MAVAEKLRHLKMLIGQNDALAEALLAGGASWSAPGLEGGLPRGALVEIVGPRKYEWFIAFLNMHPQLQCFWMEKKQQVLPTALAQRGLRLENFTFAVLGEEAFSTLRRVVQSQVFDVVLSTHVYSDLKKLRALQLFAEKAQSTVFLLNAKGPSTAWPLTLQLEIQTPAEPDSPPPFQVHVLRSRKRGLL
jgi:hypothetical protein